MTEMEYKLKQLNLSKETTQKPKDDSMQEPEQSWGDLSMQKGASIRL